MRPEPISAAADKLDRAWAATRPTEPSPEALDALWAQASARIEVRRAPLRFHDRPRRGVRARAIVGLVLVQAAAVIVAVGFRREVPRIETDPDHYSIVRVDEDGRQVEEKHDDSASVGPLMAEVTQHDFFNEVEGMATP